MGRTHAAAWAGIADAEVAGVFGRSADRARSVAALCQAEPFTDARALIRHAGVDAIDVCLPTAVHHAFVVPALEQGKHVFCESPLALRQEEARQMLAAARRADRLLQVGLLMRSVDAYQYIKKVATSGKHGRLLGLTTWRLGSYLQPGAAGHKAHYGDPSTELMTFDFDFARWLMGAPRQLTASAVRTVSGAPGEITTLLTYDDGRHATIMASGLMPRGYPFTVGFRALFEHAAFELRTVFEVSPPRSTFIVVGDTGQARPVSTPDRNPYQVELQRFVDCIRGQADPGLLDAERAIEALRLSVATQRALDEGRAIEIGTVR
jgi:predicted dehydrogenase